VSERRIISARSVQVNGLRGGSRLVRGPDHHHHARRQRQRVPQHRGLAVVIELEAADAHSPVE